MPPTTKRRPIPATDVAGTTKQRWRNYHPDTESPPFHWHEPSTSVAVTRAVQGTQVTVSEGHPFHSRSKGDKGDIGGDFTSEKRWMLPLRRGASGKRLVILGSTQYEIEYNGPCLPMEPSKAVFPDNWSSSDERLNELGATAVARCKPTNSVADVSTAIGEIVKDRLPDLPGSQTWKNRTQHARNAGDEFLNLQFGWLPLVSDVKKFASAVSKSDTVLRQYERDAGKVVRRRYAFPEQKFETESLYGPDDTIGFIQPFDSALQTGLGGQVRCVTKVTRRQWFSGAFTYALPSGYDSRNALDRLALKADVVFGATLTPETLWELAPWSWAVDWFSNTGDVISNISDWASHGLVMRYGYIMEHTYATNTYTLERTGLYGGLKEAAPIVTIVETKKRRKANPFGFGISWDGLSPIQTAIVAALGLART